MKVQLPIVSIRVRLQTMSADDVLNLSGVEKEEKRTQNGSLWDTSLNGLYIRLLTVDDDDLHMIREIQLYPKQRLVLYTVCPAQTFHQNVMISSVKCSTEVKHSE